MFGCPLTAYHQRTLTPHGQLSVVETEAQSRSESERQRHCRNISLSQNLILSNGWSHPALDRPQIRRFAIVHGLVCFYFVFNITMPIKQRTSSTAGNNKHNPITSRCLKIRPGLKTVPKLVDINFMRLILPSWRSEPRREEEWDGLVAALLVSSLIGNEDSPILKRWEQSSRRVLTGLENRQGARGETGGEDPPTLTPSHLRLVNRGVKFESCDSR